MKAKRKKKEGDGTKITVEDSASPDGRRRADDVIGKLDSDLDSWKKAAKKMTSLRARSATKTYPV